VEEKIMNYLFILAIIFQQNSQKVLSLSFITSHKNPKTRGAVQLITLVHHHQFMFIEIP
jgi:hypothetical protein